MKNKIIYVLTTYFLISLLALPSFALDRAPTQKTTPTRATPEAATGLQAKQEIYAKSYMIVTANPLASKAGEQMLAKGGSAVDAAIAAQLVLTLVEPQSSGLGGGGFALYFDKSSGKTINYNGRERAPFATEPDHFLKENGKPYSFGQAISSGLSIGVPGLTHMLGTMHKAHGKLPWRDLFAPAISLSEQGFKISPRLHKLLARKGAKHFNTAGKKLYFDAQLKARPIGYLLKNPALAKSLKTLADKGPDAFYKGAITDQIIKAAQSAPLKPSKLTHQDFKSYNTAIHIPICVPYRKFKVCGAALPSSSGLTIGIILKLLAPYNLSDPKTPLIDLITPINDAQKLAFADRNHYMADPEFVWPPVFLLTDLYINERRKSMPLKGPLRGKQKAPFGQIKKKKSNLGIDHTIEASGTTHLSIVDKDGNGLSMTSSIESAFGSGQMAAGFLLNNQLTDFSFRSHDKDGKLIANSPESGKQPRSSMSPVLVFDGQDRLRYVIGSPGGSRIIAYVTKGLIGMIDWGLSPGRAAKLFNFANRNGPLELEVNHLTKPLEKALQNKGITFRPSVMNSGLHIIQINEQGMMLSGTDPRREGLALGR